MLSADQVLPSALAFVVNEEIANRKDQGLRIWE
jgi:hypothetical protein